MDKSARQAALFLACCVLLLWGALFNRFPLVYNDTGTYIASSRPLTVPLDRPVFYSVFLRTTQELSANLWLPVAAQTAILCWLILFLIRKLWPEVKPWQSVTLVALLATATGLPWFCGQLMADVYTGIFAIAGYLLIFHGPTLTRSQKIMLAGLFTASLLVHFSHIAIAALLLILLSGSATLRKNLLLPTGLLALAIVTIPTVNRAVEGRAFFSNGHAIMMARLIRNGLVSRLLEEHCAKRNYALCAYKGEMKEINESSYLWSSKSPLEKTGGWEYSGAVTWPVIIDASLKYPWQNAGSILAQSVKQALSFGTGDGLHSYGDGYVAQMVAKHYPSQSAAFHDSKQETGELKHFISALSRLHQLVAFLALAAVIVLLLPLRRIPRVFSEGKSLVGFMILFCAINALACGSLTYISDRLQSRAIWLVVLSITLPALRWAGGEREIVHAGAIESVSTALKGSAAAASLLAFGLMFASLISRDYPTTPQSAFTYISTPVVVWPGTPKIVQRIPRSTPGDIQGLAVGSMMKTVTASGRELIGIVTAFDKDEIIMESSWERVKWPAGLQLAGEKR